MAKNRSKIKINLAEFDIVFVMVSKLMSAQSDLTLEEIKNLLLNEHALADNFEDHQLTLKKAKWKHFLWSYVDPKEQKKDDGLLTIEGQLTCVAEALDPIKYFIETYGENTLAGDFIFVNRKVSTSSPKKLDSTPSKKKSAAKPIVAKTARTKTATAKKTSVRKSSDNSTARKKPARAKASTSKKL